MQNSKFGTGAPNALRLSFALFMGVILSPPVSGQPKYSVHDLGGLGASGAQAYGINNSGQVCGSSSLLIGGVQQSHAFRTAPNSPINPATDDIGLSGFPSAGCTGINDAGQVIGSFTPGGAFLRSFRTAPNSAVNLATDELGSPNPSFGSLFGATGINNSGHVTVDSQSGFAPPITHGFRTAANSPVNAATDDLGTLSPGERFLDTETRGINNSGQVVGSSHIPAGGPHAFRTAPYSAINPATDDLGTLGGDSSYGYAINDAGQVAGWSNRADNQARMFRTAPNQAINPATDDLGILPGAAGAGVPFGINSAGQVVGNTLNAANQTVAFLYGGGVLNDLNSLIPANTGWTLQYARKINDLGQIVGAGTVNGATRSFRLDPTALGIISLMMLDTMASFKLQGDNEFQSSLDACAQSLEKGNNTAARNQLEAFENKVNVQRGKKLTDAQADVLLKLAAKAMQLM